MTPAQANLIRATALSSLAPGSGIYRDGVREALAVVDAETARALNAPRDDTAHLLATEANAQRMMEAVGQAKEDSVAYLHRRMDGWENAHIALCDRLTAMEIAVIAADDAAHVQRSSGNVFHDLGRPDADAKFEAAKEAAARLPDSPDEAGLVREAIWMAIARVDGVPAAAATAATAEVIHTLYGFGVDLRQRVEPNLDTPADSIVAEVRADLLARSERGIAEYGCTLDRKDLGLREWMEHAYHEGLDRDLYLKRAMRELDRQPAWSARDTAAFLALQAERDQLQAKVDAMATDAPVEPPHAAAPVLAPLTPEPTEAVLGRAVEALGASPLPYSVMQPGWTPPPGVLKAHSGEALAWDGQQLPVWVEFEPGVRHPYGDAAFHVAAHVTPDGKARLFPSKAAANVWLVANGTVPV